jgi:Na+/melibiose symporter-like transporter
MELDDLKQTWKQTPTNKPVNTDIMELLQHKSYGPVVALKKQFLKQIRLMIILPLLIFFTNLDDVHKVLTSVLFWTYIAFCLGLIVFSWFNYRIVQKMEGMDAMVKPNLEQQISILETRLKWHVIGVRIAFIFFVVLVEILPYFQHYSMLDKWHSLSPLIRFSSYAAFLALQYFTVRPILHRKFGQHLNYLKSLVNDMQ